MGLGTLNNRSTGQTIVEAFFNDIHSALNVDFVGRNSSGVPTASQNLGTAAIPWGVIRADSLVLDGDAVDTSEITSPQNRVVSGKTRTTSNQPAFITPNGATASFTLFAATTNLVLDINGTAVSVTTDIVKSSLTTAPAANNTCLVNDTLAVDQHDTRLWGEYGHRKSITVDTMGTEITSLIGKFAAFKLDNGSTTEYFLAFVESSTKLSKAMRGFFYNSSLDPVNRIVFSNNDTITLMKLGFVFVENDSTTVDVSYTIPVFSHTSPSSPATGDYWYDLGNQTWKRYDGASFEIINRTLVAMVVLDSTACVAARCIDFYAKYSDLLSIELEVSTTEIVRATGTYQNVSVAGNIYDFSTSPPTWNITTQLASSADMYNATEQASRLYYAYLKDTGAAVISDITPYWRGDLSGYYHPHNPWRLIGSFYNDASSDIVNAGNRSEVYLYTGVGHGSTNTKIRRFSITSINIGSFITYETSATSGASFTINEPGKYAITFMDAANAAGGTSGWGVSLNSTELTTVIGALSNPADRLIWTNNIAANFISTCSVVLDLKSGDVIRPHTYGDAPGAEGTAVTSFRIAAL